MSVFGGVEASTVPSESIMGPEIVTGSECAFSVCTGRCVGSRLGCMVAVVSLRVGDAAVSELTTWVSSLGPVSTADAVVSLRVGDAAVSGLMMRVSSFGPMGVVPSKPTGLFVLPVVMSAGEAEAPPSVSTSPVPMAEVATDSAPSAGRTFTLDYA